MTGTGEKQLTHGGTEKYFYRINRGTLKNTKDFIFGIHPILEAIKAGREINKIMLRKGIKTESIASLLKFIKQYDIPYQYVPVEKLNRITRANHQGVIAYLSVIDYKNIEEIVQRTYEDGRDPFVMVLDQITDVRNFGAIARTAECAGVDAIIIPQKGSVSITPDAIKTSAGALTRLAICRSSDLASTIRMLKSLGLIVVAVTEHASEYYHITNLLGPIALVMGSEQKGISKSLVEYSDKQVKIPMHGKIQSLNVSVASGILCYEVVRQRLQTI
jgi:23S rRNA (guanosine2251-2'-O)-methyltransferase